jgi:hypothetical protein
MRGMSIENEGTDAVGEVGKGRCSSKDKDCSDIGFSDSRCRVKCNGEGRGGGRDRAERYAEAGAETKGQGHGQRHWHWHLRWKGECGQ